MGNLIGDADGGSPPRVNALDVAAVKRALNTAAGPESNLDFNRDGRINALDVAAVKQNLNRPLPPAWPAPTADADAAPWSRVRIFTLRDQRDERDKDLFGTLSPYELS